MYDFEQMDKRYIIFGNIFLLANRLQTVMDATNLEITARQWFVIVMLEMFEEPPTLKQLAKMCDSSHQNVKQIVLKLEKKGFVRIERDEKDKRAMRIVVTAKCEEWKRENDKFSSQFVDTMFEDLSQEEILVMLKAQNKLYEKLQLMNKSKE